jgi:thiol-disulfide isomerase/thioredoxin
LRHARGEHRIVALTESNPLDSRFAMPDFFLPDVTTGESLSAPACAGEHGTVVIFLCRHCPYVVHILPEVIDIARKYKDSGVGFVGISANNATTHPEDAPAKLKAMLEERAIPFPVLYDESQGTARAFHAACTPEFYVFDSRGRLFYHGQFDDARPANGVAPSGADVRSALDDVLSGREEVSRKPVKRSLGCNIKWAPGNEPSYFHTVG